MDVLYAAGEATAADVQAGLPDSPSYSTVRALLKKLLLRKLPLRRPLPPRQRPQLMPQPTLPLQPTPKRRLPRTSTLPPRHRPASRPSSLRI